MITDGRVHLSLALTLTVACASSPSGSTTEPGDIPEPSPAGFYSAQQAARGHDAFARLCSECHAASEFRGQDFEYRWRRRTAWHLYRTMSETMPEDNPGGLPSETYVDVLAYILQLNDYAAGSTDLAATESAMVIIPLGPGARKVPTTTTSNVR